MQSNVLGIFFPGIFVYLFRNYLKSYTIIVKRLGISMIHEWSNINRQFWIDRICRTQKTQTRINKGIYIHTYSFIYIPSIVYYPYILLVIKKLLRPTHFLCKDFLISIFYITFSKLTPIVFEISKPVVVIASFLSLSKCIYIDRYAIL